MDGADDASKTYGDLDKMIAMLMERKHLKEEDVAVLTAMASSDASRRRRSSACVVANPHTRCRRCLHRRGRS